ncbi:adenylyl-sulfate kinase [Actinopolymorpha sp. B17G11]|uniref:adenylyl-sulfate kinase n=1 Tax=Actinopolymorpha sp. B17G11 TaxID=3160861 RepID=UPI0032E396F8
MDNTDVPQWAPSPAEYDDLALALDGVLPDVSVAVPDDITVPPSGLVDLTDVEGTPVARLTVASCRETAAGGQVITGSVAPLAPREDGVFRHLHRTPDDLRDVLTGSKAAAFPVDAPLSTADLARLAESVTAYDTTVLLPLVGHGSSRSLSPPALVRATTAVAALLPGRVLVVPVPLARRDDADDDARRRRLVAAAYGEPVALALDEPRVLAPGEGAYTLDGYPDRIAAIIAAEHPPLHERGLVVFFTGLSGSGKSTVARRLRDLILERGDRTVTLLDGDVVRRMLSAGLGFSRADREANVARIGFVAAEVARHGGLAICAPIAPYAATRAEVRRTVGDAGGGFVLVHVATPLEECERRDRKGLYAQARAGLIKEFTGISDPYEAPTDPDLVLDTTGTEIDAVATSVLDLLTTRGWFRPPGA